MNHVRDRGSMEYRDERGELYIFPPQGSTLHDLATTDDNLEAIRILLKHGASARIRNQSGEQAIDIARREGAVKCVTELKKHGFGSSLLRRFGLSITESSHHKELE